MPIKDKELKKISDAKYRAAHKEQIRINSLAWYYANKKRANKNSREWRKNNKERSKELVKKWRITHKERCREIVAVQYYNGPKSPNGESQWLKKARALLRQAKRIIQQSPRAHSPYLSEELKPVRSSLKQCQP